MSVDDVIAKARQLPSGAVFHRCALQVNPLHYDATYRGNALSGDAATHAAAIIDKASQLGVSVLAITDHNHVGGVAAFRAAATDKEIHIFPGFELSSSEGIHVLCIYAPDTADDLLARYLGGFGITDTKPSAKLADNAFVDILAKVREQGGVAIAAHVTHDNGLLEIPTGQARMQAWQSGDLSRPRCQLAPRLEARSLRHGHRPAWWERQPLAAVGAVIFAQVDGCRPSHREPDFGATSVKYEFAELLARAGEPT